MRVEESGYHVLALYPTTRGMAYALFEGPVTLHEWGNTCAKKQDKNEQSLAVAQRLIERYVPDAIAIQNTLAPGSRRSKRIRMLCRSIETLAAIHNVEIVRLGKSDVAKVFEHAGADTKHARFTVLGAMFPELKHKQPPRRKAWMSEHHCMGLFEAVALGVACYTRELSDA